MGIVYNSDTTSEASPQTSTVHGGGGSRSDNYKSMQPCRRNISRHMSSAVLTHQNIQLLKNLGLNLRGKQ